MDSRLVDGVKHFAFFFFHLAVVWTVNGGHDNPGRTRNRSLSCVTMLDEATNVRDISLNLIDGKDELRILDSYFDNYKISKLRN